MKCRACWSDKAYLRKESGFKEIVMSFLGLVPFKCQHCYHKFRSPWFMTWGQKLHPPKKSMPSTAGEMHAATQENACRKAA
jgi:hypothetical protein